MSLSPERKREFFEDLRVVVLLKFYSIDSSNKWWWVTEENYTTFFREANIKGRIMTAWVGM